MLEELVKELERREVLTQMIDFIIDSDVRQGFKLKTRKGLIHERVAKRAGFTLSPHLRTLINERMRAKGIRSGKIDGYGYFFDVELTSV